MLIVVVGDLGGPDSYHAGDEAMVEAGVELVRSSFKDVEVVAVSSDVVATADGLGCRAVPGFGFDELGCEADRLSRLDRLPDGELMAVLERADAVVFAGGG